MIGDFTGVTYAFQYEAFIMVKQYFCNYITRSKSLIWLLQQSIDPTLQLLVLAACQPTTIQPNTSLHSKLHVPCMYTTIIHVIGRIITATSFLSSTSTNEYSPSQVFAGGVCSAGSLKTLPSPRSSTLSTPSL